MKLTVFYDYICPFCYLTSKSLEKLSREFDLDVEWKGIEIHPEYPGSGQKSPSSLKSLKAAEFIKGAARESGTDIVLPGFRTNSRLSLEASEFAKTRNLFRSFHEMIYDAYFLKRKNIGDIKVVLETGSKSGLDVRDLEECLVNRTMFQRIEQNKKEAELNLVTGVPTLMMGNFPLYGNQTRETLRHMIRRAIERSA
ncbi:MAG TPA: DsbA family protein, partial [Thermodesulfobacteriota bacterium]|nr:DsbA family protein [Thermodesulfobacteriota bacterium]